MIRVSFVWRRLLAPYCRYIAADHPEWVSWTARENDDDWFCPRCYAGWPGPTVRIERT